MWQVKRKKGATWKQQTAVQEQRRRKKQKQGRGGAAAGSESSNESEAGSVSDSSEQRFPARAIMQIPALDNYKASGNGQLTCREQTIIIPLMGKPGLPASKGDSIGRALVFGNENNVALVFIFYVGRVSVSVNGKNLQEKSVWCLAV